MAERHTLANKRNMDTLCRGWYPKKSRKTCNNKSAGIYPHPYLCEEHYNKKALSRKSPYKECIICGKKVLITNNVKSFTCSSECWKQHNIKNGKKRNAALSNSSFISKSKSNKIAQRDNYICYYCKLPIDMKADRKKDALSYHLDHLKAVLGKDTNHSDDLSHNDNLVASHRLCNISKGNRTEPTQKSILKVRALVKFKASHDALFNKKYLAALNDMQHVNSTKKVRITKTELAKTIQIIECPSTREERTILIESLKTEKGGFSAASLAKIGVSYPPQKGWRHKAMENGW